MNEQKFPLIMKFLMVFGLVLNYALVAVGFIWIIPSWGTNGVVVTVAWFGVALFSSYRVLTYFRHRQ